MFVGVTDASEACSRVWSVRLVDYRLQLTTPLEMTLCRKWHRNDFLGSLRAMRVKLAKLHAGFTNFLTRSISYEVEFMRY